MYSYELLFIIILVFIFLSLLLIVTETLNCEGVKMAVNHNSIR